MNNKEQLFDEFGNYQGEVEDSDSDDDSFEEEFEEEPEPKEKNPEPKEEAPKQEITLFEDKNYYPTLQEAFPEAEVMIEEEDAMEIEEPILPPPQTQKYHLTGHVDGNFNLETKYKEQSFLQGMLGTAEDNRNFAVIGPYHSGKTMLVDLLIQEQSVYVKDSRGEMDDKKGMILIWLTLRLFTQKQNEFAHK